MSDLYINNGMVTDEVSVYLDSVCLLLVEFLVTVDGSVVGFHIVDGN